MSHSDDDYLDLVVHVNDIVTKRSKPEHTNALVNQLS